MQFLAGFLLFGTYECRRGGDNICGGGVSGGIIICGLGIDRFSLTRDATVGFFCYRSKVLNLTSSYFTKKKNSMFSTLQFDKNFPPHLFSTQQFSCHILNICYLLSEKLVKKFVKMGMILTIFIFSTFQVETDFYDKIKHEII